jgi:adenosine kinase
VKIAVTGSIATDHLMTFRGRFRDSLVVEQLDKISLSFLADELEIRRGGVAANIAFGMANLGQHPALVGSVGEDFADYRSWLERHGVDCESVHVSDSRHTARFVCTTDDDMAQIATFYAGAMSDARLIELQPIAKRLGGLDLVLIGANDPQAMLRHTEECRTRGIPFIADPSQQLAFADGPEIRRLVDGAAYLFTNEYEAHLTEQKTGWSGDDILKRVGVRIVTRGSDGVDILAEGAETIHVPVAREVRKADPTGVGDAFRAGFMTGLAGGLGLRRCAELGSMLATYVFETVGTQEFQLRQ